VHGGCYGDLGFNSFTVFPATRALGMPFPLAIAATGMIVEGVLDQFPKLRIGFLEGGTAWLPIVIDRLERELEYGGSASKENRKTMYQRLIFVGRRQRESAGLRHRARRPGAVHVRLGLSARDIAR
jgi:hypothetical protein